MYKCYHTSMMDAEHSRQPLASTADEKFEIARVIILTVTTEKMALLQAMSQDSAHI